MFGDLCGGFNCGLRVIGKQPFSSSRPLCMKRVMNKRRAIARDCSFYTLLVLSLECLFVAGQF